MKKHIFVQRKNWNKGKDNLPKQFPVREHLIYSSPATFAFNSQEQKGSE